MRAQSIILGHTTPRIVIRDLRPAYNTLAIIASLHRIGIREYHIFDIPGGSPFVIPN